MISRGWYLRVSLTPRCNLRCVYCLPAKARFPENAASELELRSLIDAIAGAAPLRKIRFTGGEPTLCESLPDIVRRARNHVPVVGLTTNGVLLKPILPALADAGLTNLNISLDAVDADGFRRFSRRNELARVVESIRSAKRIGFTPVKINAVATRWSDVAALVRFALWEGVHLRFIELMSIGEARRFHAEAFISSHDIREKLFAAGFSMRERIDLDEPTSRVWAVDGNDPGHCTVGFITTMSAPFCDTCDRLRLSSQGRLFTCLMDNRGHDLIAKLRRGDPAALAATVRGAIQSKQPPESFVRHDNMASIGG
jgi:cyclic pyranopterin phosphate synthase